MKRKKDSIHDVSPDFLDRQKDSLVRRNREVIYLNDKERDAINLYCKRFGVRCKSVLFRKAIMEKVLTELDETHPTLF
ncbi:MAG: hypothetical protein LKI59_06875 [Bacteroidales bacterium]|nr:hypothetical protein [Bacteroidales bacterium]